MTVAEFIKKLEKYPSNADVLATWEGGYSSLYRICIEEGRVIIDVDHYRSDPAGAAKEDEKADEED